LIADWLSGRTWVPDNAYQAPTWGSVKTSAPEAADTIRDSVLPEATLTACQAPAASGAVKTVKVRPPCAAVVAAYQNVATGADASRMNAGLSA
jgi:hypothetical protein